MPPAPIQANVGGDSQIGSLLMGGAPGQGADQARAQIEGLAQQVMGLGQQLDALAVDFPAAAPEVAQAKNILKAIVVKAAQQAPMMTASGSAVPTGTSSGPMPQ